MMYKQIFSKLIFFIISSILLNDFFIFTNAEIKSKNESQEFLKTYCVEILNAIKSKNLSKTPDTITLDWYTQLNAFNE